VTEKYQSEVGRRIQVAVTVEKKVSRRFEPRVQ
jgi:hypothetical protein